MRRSHAGHGMTTIALAALAGCSAVAPKFYAPDLTPPAPVDTAASAPPAPPPAPVTRTVSTTVVRELGPRDAPWARQATTTTTTTTTVSLPLPPQLEAEVKNARLLQRQYSDVVQSFSDGTVGLGTALITGGTFGAAKAATRVYPRDVAGLAAVLGGIYTYGNTMMPAGRVEAFRTGVLALECAIGAATSLNEPDLRAAADEARTAKAQLDMDAFALKSWQRPIKEEKKSGGPSAGCNKPLHCDSSNAKCTEAAKSYALLCSPAKVTEVSIPPHPDVQALLPPAEELRRRLGAGLPVAARFLVQMDLAADDLRGRVRSIEAAVIEEAAKSQPNLASIKAAAASSAEAGGAFIPLPKAVTQPPVPAPAPSGDAGKALTSSSSDSDTGAVAKVQKRPADLDGVRARVLSASLAWDKLQFALVGMHSRLQRAQAMEGCSVRGVARPTAVLSNELLKADAADVQLNDELRRRLAPLLGIDAKSQSLTREVDEALRDCHGRGVIDDPSGGTLPAAAVVSVTLGQCRKGAAS